MNGPFWNTTANYLLLFPSAVVLAFAAGARAEVPVFVGPGSAPAERIAAQDLATNLGRLYLREKFPLVDVVPEKGNYISVGTRVLTKAPAPAESFVVTTSKEGGREFGVIAGADARGTVRGVYALLEKLGCGFFLSYDALPPARASAFSFDGWDLSDRPLVRDRIVFDWHNFLSGCSTWNLEEWNRWTDQSQKMGYNAVMVHAYGNNPMVSFEFNGKTKPVGYLSTTLKGRDWSTMHVNDVRRLFGGEVFITPVFGAEAAQVPDEKRADAARSLMQSVFAHAQQRSMEVFFAVDVDTGSANPQELIQTLPESARFAVRTKAGGMTGVSGEGEQAFWLANPETPEGYGYYKAQVQALLSAYPQITCLVVWFRNGGTPWMDLKVSEMPAAWQAEYKAAIAKNPEAEKFWHSQSLFAIGKITRAFDRALKELGHERVRLASGTWNFAFLPGADLFLPQQVPLIGLDYGILHDDSKLSTEEHRKNLAEVGAHRPLIPVIWAHHDDGNYLGRSYTPFSDFLAKLEEAKASGFGIIHWTTRPLDLFFTSHIRQVWQQTRNEPLRATCEHMAARSFGPASDLAGYLEAWVTGAPKFSRETSDHFIDRPLTDIEPVIRGCRERLELLKRVDVSKLTPDQAGRVEYSCGLENFIAAFFEAHGRFQDAQAAFQKGDLSGARATMQKCQAESVIEEYAKFSSLGGMTRGEQGSVVSLNTRWLPHIVHLRQQLGLDSVRYKFGPTSHDPLAQAPGQFTFFFDAGRQVWETLGPKETGAESFVCKTSKSQGGTGEIYCSGIESDKPIEVVLAPILAKKKNFSSVPAGDYRLRLYLLDPTSTAPGQRVFSVGASITFDRSMVRVDFAPLKTQLAERLDLFTEAGGNQRSLERVYNVSLPSAGYVTVKLTPIAGKVAICGATLEPK